MRFRLPKERATTLKHGLIKRLDRIRVAPMLSTKPAHVHEVRPAKTNAASISFPMRSHLVASATPSRIQSVPARLYSPLKSCTNSPRSGKKFTTKQDVVSD